MRKPFILQPRDVNIFRTLYQRRYLTVAHLALLCPSPAPTKIINPQGQSRGGQEALRKRFIKLKRYGFLGQVSYQIRRPNEPTVFYLEEEGARELALKGLYPFDQLMKQVRYIRKTLTGRRTQNKYFFLNHELELNAFYAALWSVLRTHPRAEWDSQDETNPSWLQPNVQNNFKIRVEMKKTDVPEKLRRRLPGLSTKVQLVKAPDAVFTLRVTDDQGRQHRIGFLYEKDKGTETHSRIATKLLCYWQWYKQGLHEKFFGTRQLRVLIETESEQRIENMIRRAVGTIKPQGSALFWFTTRANISLANPTKLLEPIWQVAHANLLKDQHSLLEI